jgi:phosphate acyltransferase
LVSPNGASGPVTVAVDAMGGDYAPTEILKGAAAAKGQGVNVVVVGLEAIVRRELRELNIDLSVVNAPGVISMDEPVSQALRRPDSSLRVAARLVTAGEADAVVSCGNSVAIMAIAKREWGDLPGIDRPAFGGFLPARNGRVFVLDIGANSTVKASNLLQFAVMGDVYVRLARDLENPRVGLLSNGTEANKGTKEVKEANEALRKLPEINFVGNVEGNQVFEGVVDVVVCDGFAGNVLLKGAEGAVNEVFELLKAALSRDLMSKIAGAAMMPALTSIKRRVDYEEYGGVPVLGVNEVMINCHGRSKSKAVMNGILLADRLAREHLTERIRAALHEEDVEVGRRARLARALHLRHE